VYKNYYLKIHLNQLASKSTCLKINLPQNQLASKSTCLKINLPQNMDATVKNDRKTIKTL